ncbi:MAG: UDP-glucose/GDP-mannose dehydrogenase family protein, partial [archaeon]|nr:UDP-glucose/GDP-mannose dehydrogenase family protein [archaeon]
MKIAMIGSGYVGLTTGSCLAKLGHEVTCVDNNEEKINSLKAGKMPIFEPGLKELVEENVLHKKLFFSTDVKMAVKRSDVVFIAVGTPPKLTGEADLSFVEAVARETARAIEKYTVVVEKSTVPVETGEKISKAIESEGVKKELFDVVSNPEFLREGNAITDFLHADRIVVGTESEKARKIMKSLYSGINAPVVFTDIRSAEMIKHASNSFLATKISFINAIARLCDLYGADVEQVSLGMGLDKRIGRDFLKAGIGYGGSCFPK